MSSFLRGLGRGMATTAKTLTKKSVTQQYPHERPALPPRSRGVVALFEENCTSCMLCARECPDWCIYIDSHKETVEPGPEGGRAKTHNVLDRFAIDFSLCMYCGICIEVCPFEALFWSNDFEYAETDILGMVHEKDRLGVWMAGVPFEALPDNHPRRLEAAAEAAAAAQAHAAEAEPVGQGPSEPTTERSDDERPAE